MVIGIGDTFTPKSLQFLYCLLESALDFVEMVWLIFFPMHG
ncbi:hypothetical protein TevJSym_aa01900 [endosymbiont of Tevnia jerichonana (vent Tica)]|uniref:Uncharacterized protein n=1 Tax=endosymbiont of Tevnia jerichonana (vent Tica) TaxID=1049564 RepID=G2FBA8_9GAMM|nr:hypothetical protein TevJSym_aa01900 [endosymbiont of Tevnia jerichonana (vent Tica)]